MYNVSRLKNQLGEMGYDALLRCVRQLELLASSFGLGVDALVHAAVARMLEVEAVRSTTRRWSNREEILRELMNVYSDSDRAERLVNNIGFPPQLRPKFTDSQSYFDKVVRCLEAGILPDGFDKLVGAAAREFPYNPIFAAAGGAPPRPELLAVVLELVSNGQMGPVSASSSGTSFGSPHIAVVKQMRRHFVRLDDDSAVRVLDAFLTNARYEDVQARVGLDDAEFARVMKCLRQEVGNHAMQDQR